MADQYYVNWNPQQPPEDGEHEVHKQGCPTPPLHHNRYNLGYFNNCREAVAAARKKFKNVDGCGNCIPACHSR